jgi:hypothetical protein
MKATECQQNNFHWNWTKNNRPLTFSLSKMDNSSVINKHTNSISSIGGITSRPLAKICNFSNSPQPVGKAW